MKPGHLNPFTLAVATLTGLFSTLQADAQITVSAERAAINLPTDGTFVFSNIPSNSSVDLANGKTFALLAGTPSTAAGPISVLTNGLAQTNHDSVAESFFATGTSEIRVQLDLGSSFDLGQINSYSWHQNTRAPQIYKVYGAVSPGNSTPDFTTAPFQDEGALGALGYTLIGTVNTQALGQAGQHGVSIAGDIGSYRYLLFDMAPPVWGVGPRPTFFGEIDVIAAPEQPFPLTITPATPPATGFDLAWESRPLRIYQLRSSTDLATPLDDWEVVASNIASTPPENTYNVPQDGPRRFYRVEQELLPPLFTADFEGSGNGFEAATAQGTSWVRGAPTSGSVAIPNTGGFVVGGNGGSAECWGTNIGNPGFYTPPTTTRLRSPIINLSGVAGAQLTFAQALDIGASDTAVVNIINATTDDIIVPAIHTSTDSSLTSALWSTISPINLAAVIGQQIRIEWVFTGQTGEDYMGWYLDDVVVTETAP